MPVIDPDLSAVLEVLSGGFDPQRAMDASRSVGDIVHEHVKRHAVTSSTTREAIAVGAHVAAQILVETIAFAEKSMEGDASEERLIRTATIELFRGLVAQAYPDAFGSVH